MSYQFQHLKVYEADIVGSTPQHYKQVFYENEFNSINLELALENSFYGKEIWEATFTIYCFRFIKGGKNIVCKHKEIVKITPDNEVYYFRFGKTKEELPVNWEAGEYIWQVQSNDGLFETARFHINKTKDDSKFFTLESFSLYEGAEHDELSAPSKLKEHKATFEIQRTRFVRAAAIFKNTNTDSWKEEFIFKFYDQDNDKLIGITPVVRQINGQDKFVVTGGWGNEKLGTWKEGKYRVNLVIRDEVIAEEYFECLLKKSPPATSPFPISEEAPPRPSKKPVYLDLKNLKPFPKQIEDKDAVLISYKPELDKIADYLRNGLSVLVVCDKILVEFIYQYVCLKADKDIIIDKSYDIKDLYEQIEALKKGEIMILRSIDILQYSPMGSFLLYHTLKGQNAQFLAFNDPNQALDKVLTNRFSVHVPLLGMPKQIYVQDPEQADKTLEINTLTHLITQKEKACFEEYKPDALYKQVASLNIIQFRQAMKYIGTQFTQPSPAKKIYQEIRQFKVDMLGDDIEIPTTTFDDIGGYNNVKKLLHRMLSMFFNVREETDKKLQIRSKGFIFHGPPGTGKTLFAKAIANEMNATIQMISGPEIMEKWVGQSEANMRKIFATARRNAPSVILFDEFDSIAGKRSTEANDGGARVGNSLMAQLLTELDGFREEDGILVIGTTNILKAIDKALLRPSRLTAVEIGKPDFEARKQVARIHAQNLEVDQIIKDLFLLANNYIDDWDTNGRETIPQELLDKLYEQNPSTQQRRKQEFSVLDFQSELNDFFKFILRLKKEQSEIEQESSLISQMEVQLDKLGKKYGLAVTPVKAEEEEDKINPVYEIQEKRISLFDHDIQELFQVVKKSKESEGQVSADTYFDAILNLIAEFTEDFNNDQIRLIFQEAYIDFVSSGQVITPRYLGQKIGLIQNDKDKSDDTFSS